MEEGQQAVVHNLSNFANDKSFLTRKVIVLFVVIVFFGILTGYLISQLFITPANTKQGLLGTPQVNGARVYGSADEKIFKDMAEGVLKEGGIDGEGSHHLERLGGASQNVYLTSSIVDLSQFVNKKVKVWGQTYKAKKAGWLMDVGRLQVLE